MRFMSDYLFILIKNQKIFTSIRNICKNQGPKHGHIVQHLLYIGTCCFTVGYI